MTVAISKSGFCNQSEGKRQSATCSAESDNADYRKDDSPVVARLRDIASPKAMMWVIPELWEHFIYLLHTFYGELVKHPRYPAVLMATQETPPRYARKIVKKAFYIDPSGSARLARIIATEEIFPTGDALISAMERLAECLDEFDRIVDSGGAGVIENESSKSFFPFA